MVVKRSNGIYEKNGTLNINIPFQDKVNYLISICNYNFDSNIEEAHIDAAYASAKVLEYNHIYKYRRKTKTLVRAMEGFVKSLVERLGNGTVLRNYETEFIRNIEMDRFRFPRFLS
jgi:hypothetical protein